METKQYNATNALKRNYINGRALSFGDLEQIKVLHEHQMKIIGLMPVAHAAFRWSKLVFFFDCVNNRCRKKNLHKYNTRFISNLMYSYLACPGCGHLYRFRNGEDQKPGLYYAEAMAEA